MPREVINMYMRVLIVVLLVSCSALFAETYGTVGDVPMDDFFLQTLQFVHPEFSFTPDSVAFVSKLQKAYIYDLAFADEARKVGLDKDPEVKAALERIKMLIENAYLAQEYRKYMASQKVTVSDKEARAFYENNISQFTEPGVYSYLWATIHDTSKANIKVVREKLKTYSKLGTALDEFKMGSPGTYSMVFERGQTIRPGNPLYERIRDAELEEIVGPFDSEGQLMMIVVVERTPEKIIPFSEVKEICRQNVVAEKVNAAMDRIRKDAMKEYPISFSPQYFRMGK